MRMYFKLIKKHAATFKRMSKKDPDDQKLIVPVILGILLLLGILAYFYGGWELVYDLVRPFIENGGDPN